MRVYADLFKALSDETRLAALALIMAHGELCVCDVEAVLAITQSKASRHLRYLKNVGLLDDRRDGIWVHYRLARKPSTEAAATIRSNRKLIEGMLNEKLLQKLKTWLAGKDCCRSCRTVAQKAR